MVRSPSLDNVGASLVYRIGSTATYKKLFRYWYPLMTKRLGQGDDVQFLNWGYEEDPPLGLALDAVVSGAVFALWPVMWIVINALLIYNIAVRSGRFDAFRNWVANYLPNDRRIVLVVIGFCFGALLEGVAGGV